jgi:hypothetical protein
VGEALHLSGFEEREQGKSDEQRAGPAEIRRSFFRRDHLGRGRGCGRAQPRIVHVAERARIDAHRPSHGFAARHVRANELHLVMVGRPSNVGEEDARFAVVLVVGLAARAHAGRTRLGGRRRHDEGALRVVEPLLPCRSRPCDAEHRAVALHAALREQALLVANVEHERAARDALRRFDAHVKRAVGPRYDSERNGKRLALGLGGHRRAIERRDVGVGDREIERAERAPFDLHRERVVDGRGPRAFELDANVVGHDAGLDPSRRWRHAHPHAEPEQRRAGRPKAVPSNTTSDLSKDLHCPTSTYPTLHSRDNFSKVDGKFTGS